MVVEVTTNSFVSQGDKTDYSRSPVVAVNSYLIVMGKASKLRCGIVLSEDHQGKPASRDTAQDMVSGNG